MFVNAGARQNADTATKAVVNASAAANGAAMGIMIMTAEIVIAAGITTTVIKLRATAINLSLTIMTIR
jgi:hypothetical protein